MSAARRFLAWMARPRISLLDRIAIFVAFLGLLLGCVIAMSGVWHGVRDIRAVRGHGTDTVARVEPDRSFSDFSEIIYDGHTKSIRRDLPPDAARAVTYLPQTPDVVVFGHSDDGVIALYLANVGWMSSFNFIVGLVGGLGCLACLVAAIAPAGRARR